MQKVIFCNFWRVGHAQKVRPAGKAMGPEGVTCLGELFQQAHLHFFQRQLMVWDAKKD